MDHARICGPRRRPAHRRVATVAFPILATAGQVGVALLGHRLRNRGFGRLGARPGRDRDQTRRDRYFYHDATPPDAGQTSSDLVCHSGPCGVRCVRILDRSLQWCRRQPSFRGSGATRGAVTERARPRADGGQDRSRGEAPQRDRGGYCQVRGYRRGRGRRIRRGGNHRHGFPRHQQVVPRRRPCPRSDTSREPHLRSRPRRPGPGGV